MVIVVAWFSALNASGQTIPAGSYDVPPLTIGDDESIGSNTTLNIYQDGVVGNNFTAGIFAVPNNNLLVNLAGGSIGDGFEVHEDAVVNVTGGSIGRSATAYSGSRIVLTGGSIDFGLEILGGMVEVDGGEIIGGIDIYGGGVLNQISGESVSVSYLSGSSTLNVSGGELRTRNTMFGTINVSGGAIASRLVTGQGAELNMMGGELASNSIIYYQSTVNVSGGRVGAGLYVVNASSLQMTGGVIDSNVFSRFYVGSNTPVRLAGGAVGDGIEKRVGSERLVLAGSDFRLDGVPIADLANDGDELAFELPTGGVLTGVHPDGTPFAYSSLEGDILPTGSLLLEQASLAGTHPNAISLPADSSPHGVHAGQTLNIQAGAVVDSHLMAGWGSTVNVDGGEVGYDFEAAGAVVNVLGGSVGNSFDMFHDSTLEVTGGSLGNSGRLYAAALTMTGGIVGSDLNASNGSTLQLAGGALGDGLTLDASSQMTLVGGDFRLEGVPVAGLTLAGDSVPLDLPSNAVLSGILADGTPFAMTTQDGDTLPAGSLTLQQSDLPPVGAASVNAAVDEVGYGIRSGQTLSVGEGSELAAHYNMAPGSQINVTGGTVGTNLEAVAATVNLSSGVIDSDFDAYQGTLLTMTGGELGSNAWLDNGSQLVQSGGDSSTLTATRMSLVEVSGGTAHSIAARQGSQVAISGGVVQQLTLTESQGVISGGLITNTVALSDASALQWSGGRVATIDASSSTASVALQGADFFLDGVEVVGLNVSGDQIALQVPTGSVLSGVLADGATFAIGNGMRSNDQLPSDQVTLTYSVPPPPSVAVIQVPSDLPPASVRAGQTLRVDEGGVVGDYVTAGNGSRVEVNAGGSIGDNFEAVGADVIVDGGEIGGQLDVFADATLTMQSGRIGVGGSRSGVLVLGGTLDLYGGEVASALVVENSGALNVFGYDFTLSGEPIDELLLGEALSIPQRDGTTLAGVLADGTPFDFKLQQTTSRSFDIFSLDSMVTITLVEPAMFPGDFNGDGLVNGSDFLTWQSDPGVGDLAEWQSNYDGATPSTSASEAVPEPSTSLCTMLFGLIGMMLRGRSSCFRSDRSLRGVCWSIN